MLLFQLFILFSPFYILSALLLYSFEAFFHLFKLFQPSYLLNIHLSTVSAFLYCQLYV